MNSSPFGPWTVTASKEDFDPLPKVNSKCTLHESLTATNTSNHLDALAVRDNIADPEYGVFFGNDHRRYRGDFEVLF